MAALLVAAWLIFVAFQIVRTGETHSAEPADAAIVLGAAVHGNQPSPVFQARIDHGVTLYQTGKVRWLVLTGGTGEGQLYAEAVVARDYAIRQGVPASAILMETRSHTTSQNFDEAAPLLRGNGIRTALVVSDPLHLMRALRMARDRGIDARPAPAPGTRYRGFWSRAGFLLRELYFYHHYLVTGD